MNYQFLRVYEKIYIKFNIIFLLLGGPLICVAANADPIEFSIYGVGRDG